MLGAIRAAARGDRYLDQALGTRVSGQMAERRGEAATKTRITERETEVLRLIALGHSNKEIATQLSLSVKTVEVHKANAMRKLGLTGRIGIVQYAVLQGWLDNP